MSPLCVSPHPHLPAPESWWNIENDPDFITHEQADCNRAWAGRKEAQVACHTAARLRAEKKFFS